MSNPGLRRGQSGFTLIEMLVVLALMAALMFFSIPAILPVIHQSKLTGIANEVKSLMFLARLNAIRNSCRRTRPIPSLRCRRSRTATPTAS
jgi:prepilin-type N-terminal cleavage/methylation domain-containing protein